ncbi:MAG: hypothetical protein FWF96_08185 [Kiritimatiellaeota bacterium]|nr:hypothetical protein [Kiritimatiellota bacterium]
MPSQFDFWYAVNNTEVVLAPKRHLETFGNTLVNYTLVCELMDTVGRVRIREGRLQGNQPQIVTPSSYAQLMLEGFGHEAQRYAEWLREHEGEMRILRYGYEWKQEAYSEEVVAGPIEEVLDRVKADAGRRDQPFQAVVKGVDDPWDVCVLHMFFLLANKSFKPNVRELEARRMFEARAGLPPDVRTEVERAFRAAERDASLTRALGKMLHERGVFEQYQDRFFALVNKKP